MSLNQEIGVKRFSFYISAYGSVLYSKSSSLWGYITPVGGVVDGTFCLMSKVVLRPNFVVLSFHNFFKHDFYDSTMFYGCKARFGFHLDENLENYLEVRKKKKS